MTMQLALIYKSGSTKRLSTPRFFFRCGLASTQCFFSTSPDVNIFENDACASTCRRTKAETFEDDYIDDLVESVIADRSTAF